GMLAPVDAVAIGYLPASLPRLTGMPAEAIIGGWCNNLPVVTAVLETSLGRIGVMTLPRFESQLYEDREGLLGVLRNALHTAGHLGARVVSLTGLLPSATDYGRALARKVAGQKLPAITTGHATTTATVVLPVRRALEEAGRDPAAEHAGFLGLGSVGLATLRLMLGCLPHPAELTLCDVYSKRQALLELRREV